VIKTYKFRLKDKHCHELNRKARIVNFVWNFCNDTQRHALKWGKRWPTNYDLQRLTTGSSKELGLQADILARVCDKYVIARRAQKKSFLRYRGRKNLGWIPLRGRRIRFSGNGFICHGKVYSVWLSRLIPEGARICDGSSFSQDSKGRWYLNVLFDVPEVEKRIIDRTVGIDLGLKDLAALSTGEKIEAPQIYRNMQERLSKARRANKGRQVTNIHAKIANQRKDFLHKVSTQIVRDFDKIIVGDVNAEGLKQTTMAKSVSDAGWSMLRHQLRYKAIAHGAEYVEVSEKFTTQTCSDCGSVSGPKGIAGLGIREWECPCGSVHDRDVNSAKNILRLGCQTLAEGAVQ
jgi:IS605 OrfB family transposase